LTACGKIFANDPNFGNFNPRHHRGLLARAAIKIAVAARELRKRGHPENQP